VLAIHDEQIARHGGAAGVRDVNVLRPALARPQNRAGYEMPDAFGLAADYAFGIVRNHGFVDGNKRTAFVTCVVFLLDNGILLTADDASAVRMTLALAAGEIDAASFAAWLRDHAAPAP
jgi:death-on-curing protein